MNIITGEKFQELADVSIALNIESNYNSELVQTQLKNINTKCFVFDPDVSVTSIPDDIKYAKSVFVYTHVLPYFFNNIFPHIQGPITLISHNSDAGVDANMLTYLDSPKIKNWFCQNKYVTHPKLFSLPIAIANSQWLHGNLQSLRSIIDQNITKTELVYKNFSIGTNFSHRQQVDIETKENGFYMAPNTSFEAYLKQIKQSYYSFAPHGNGVDCHRIWECLYLNCVPIVPKSLPCFDDFKHLPIMFVDNYKQVTKEFLEKKIEEFYPFSKFDLQVLDLFYWKNKIQAL
jgi:hypothetical protein